MMFYLPDETGAASTGPHTVGEVRRRMAGGEIGWQTLLCVRGTEDWVPASVYEDVLREAAPPREMMVCAQCGAQEIQKLKSIYEGGTSLSTYKGTTVGGYGDLGDGDGFDGVMVGFNQGKKTTATLLAQRCAPPNADNYGHKSNSTSGWTLFGGSMLFFGGMFVALVAKSLIGGIVGVIGMAFVLLAFREDAVEKKRRRQMDSYYGRVYREWERRYYCHRCGQMGEPVKVQR